MHTLGSIPVFYHPRMVANAESFSPSAAKPQAVVDSWRTLGLPLDIRPVKPVTVKDLCLAHDPDMVREILAGERENGFGNTLVSVARSLPYTSGAMVDAAREAVSNGHGAVAPVSGFHHAGYDYCGGFCTFNGLVVATRVLLEEGIVHRVGILDFDQHFGDGTADCIRQLKLGSQVEHFTAGRGYRNVDQAEAFLDRIPQIVGRMRNCGVLLYQAGADPHIDDPLGGWLTDAQLALRDKLVFESARGLGIPVAWNLAGGYQEPISAVLSIHNETLKAFAGVYLDS